MVQNILLLSAGGAVGTLLRYGLSGLAHRLLGETFPWGTLLVNVLGCFVIGLLWAASERAAFGPSLRIFLFTGTLGAFTTFSTYGLETFVLLKNGNVALGAANLILSNVIGLAAVIAGFLSVTSVMRVLAAILCLLIVLPLPGWAQDDSSAPADPPVLAELRVSDDGRRIVHSDGTPFFWLGDTAWELFHRLDSTEASMYLEDRSRKGFNVVQAVALAELDGLHTPNPYGETPLIDDDPERPNDAYFQHVDYIVSRANELGMYVGLLPTWGDKFNLKWGVGPEIFTPENARTYGRYIGERYADDAVIWILGGDRSPESNDHLAIIRSMAEGIEEGSAGSGLMTYHPMGGSRSWEWFPEDAWLDIHLFQSSHGSFDHPNYLMTAEGYALLPTKPVLDGEPRYEDHPVDWDPEQGWFDAFDVRQAMYWSVLAGAAGNTYGNHNIWQMWQPERDPISSARTPWREALAHPGAAQAGFAKRLFLSRPFLDLLPDQSLVADGQKDGPMHVRAARDRGGAYLMAYIPYGSPVEIDLTRLSGEEFHAWWFDPRTGTATEFGSFARETSRRFDPPGTESRGNDWILVIDDAAEQFGPPGRD